MFPFLLSRRMTRKHSCEPSKKQPRPRRPPQRYDRQNSRLSIVLKDITICTVNFEFINFDVFATSMRPWNALKETASIKIYFTVNVKYLNEYFVPMISLSSLNLLTTVIVALVLPWLPKVELELLPWPMPRIRIQQRKKERRKEKEKM